MGCIGGKTALLATMLAAVPAAADEDVDRLIAYLLNELESRQAACSEAQLAEHPGLRVVCGEYDDSFSQLKSDWELLMRHTRLPMPMSTDDAWTFRDGAYRVVYTFGADRKLHVALHANGDRLKFAYSEQDVDPYAAPAGGTNASPLDTGKPAQPRVAGFGGVSVPRLIAESRVDPLRSTRARLERVAGIVTLEIVVQKDGSVREAVALSAEPDGYDFGASAVEAVRQWRFEPAVFEGRPVDAVLNLTIEVKQDPPPPAGD